MASIWLPRFGICRSLLGNITTRVYRFDPTVSSGLTEIGRANHGGTVHSVAWRPDGKYLATGGIPNFGTTPSMLLIHRLLVRILY